MVFSTNAVYPDASCFALFHVLHTIVVSILLIILLTHATVAAEKYTETPEAPGNGLGQLLVKDMLCRTFPNVHHRILRAARNAEVASKCRKWRGSRSRQQHEDTGRPLKRKGHHG